MRMAIYICGLPPQTHHPNLTVKKHIRQSQTEVHFTKHLSSPRQICQGFKNKESDKLGQPRRSSEDMTIKSKDPGQKKDIREKLMKSK